MKKRKQNQKSSVTGVAVNLLNNSRSQKDFPNQFKKDSCAYLNGEVSLSCYGIHHVLLQNGLKCICTSRKMDKLKIKILVGDVVTVEIPMSSLSTIDDLKGRVVWRNH